MCKEGLASNLFPVSQLFEWSYLAAFLSIDNLKFMKITRHRRFLIYRKKFFWEHKLFLKIIVLCLKNRKTFHGIDERFRDFLRR